MADAATIGFGMPTLPLQRELQRIAVIPDEAMRAAVETCRATGKPLADVLLTMGRVTRADVAEAMWTAGKPMEVTQLAQVPKWDTLLSDLDRDAAVVAIAQSDDPRKRFFVAQVKGVPDSRTFGARARAAAKGFRLAGTLLVTSDFMTVLLAGKQRQQQAAGETSSQPDQASLAADFDALAHRAFRERASDIHITLFPGRGEVKFRIDGELELVADWTEDYTNAFVAAAYNTLTETGSTRSGFNATQRLDGAIERMFPEGLVRFRFASIPMAPSGFDCTLRLIPIGVERKQLSMADLGYSKDQQDDLDRMFAHSSGLIFFLGTTGSGKSTSMAVALEGVARAKPGKKIRTVEQPVEYRIEGAYQTSVAKEDFIPTLSQLMRMDPDYLMVGETRDDVTAQTVLQAARSGHLCVSTLHADGAPLAYDRLVGLGIDRHELASVGLVCGLVYQKLVQCVCPHCKQPASEWAAQNPDAPILRRLAKIVPSLDGIYFARSGGCPKCRHKGVHGRTVAAEILRPTVPMLAAIAAGDSRNIWKHWRAQIDPARPDVMRGRTAFEHAIWKMRQGIVSPQSVETEFRFLDEPPFEEVMDA